MSQLELWGGHECTVSRVGDAVMDQTVRTGHEHREDDLDAFAALGLKALRYPILWERVAPERPDESNWDWSDRRLARLRALKLRVIAGLIHHGSGPRYVDLLSPAFAPGLARHAAAVAQRYPWLEDWTPVNEPLTTARFSALYGHWYPHRRDEHSFWLAVLNQVDATRLSMREVRQVNPHARLVQTDDLGRTYSTPELSRQAEHDNERRWMAWDLLFGRVVPGHPFWARLVKLGFEDRLREIADDPCPPDIVGINHYLTSDRFLDHRCELYPGVPCGGNERQRYVDVEAIRVVSPAPAGVGGAIREAWARFGARLAITEAHNACTREEQVRWFAKAWREARAAHAEGVDIAAVTAWSLLGAYDWNSLLTQDRGHYEAGAFDVSAGVRRPTALARYLRRLSEDPDATPECAGRGWWNRHIRFQHRSVRVDDRSTFQPARARPPAQPILIIGATGTLGRAIARACTWRDLRYVLTSRRELSLCEPDTIERALERYHPRAVINAAGWVRVDDAEREVEACRNANTEGVVHLARICAERGVPLTTFSSDLVFDGAAQKPYTETDQPNPLNVYGMSKAEAEQAIMWSCENALIVRSAAFFSPFDPYNFAAWVVRELRQGRIVECASDSVVSPTYTPALANAVLDLVLDGDRGVWHVANAGALSWTEFARELAKAARLDHRLVQPRSCAELGWIAPRPRYSALTSQRGALLRGLDEAIWEFARTVEGLPHAALHQPRVAA